MGPSPAPETGSQPSLMEKIRIRMGPSAKLGNDRPPSEHDAEDAVRPASAMQRGVDAGGDGHGDADQQRGQGERQRVGIALQNQVGDGVVQAKRLAQVARAGRRASSADIACRAEHRGRRRGAGRTCLTAVAPSPSICAMGSPGTRWMRRKTTETTTQRTGRVMRTRRTGLGMEGKVRVIRGKWSVVVGELDWLSLNRRCGCSPG